MNLMLLFILPMIIFFVMVSGTVYFVSKFSKGEREYQSERDHRWRQEHQHKVNQQNTRVERNERRPLPGRNADTKQVPLEERLRAYKMSKETSEQRNEKKNEMRKADKERFSHHRRQKSESVLKQVVPLTKKKKKRASSARFSKKRMNEAVIYKEILDKPLSLRDE